MKKVKGEAEKPALSFAFAATRGAIEDRNGQKSSKNGQKVAFLP